MKKFILLSIVFMSNISQARDPFEYALRKVLNRAVDQAIAKPWFCQSVVEYCRAGQVNCLDSQFDQGQTRSFNQFTIFQVNPHGRYDDAVTGCMTVTRNDVVSNAINYAGAQYRVLRVQCSSEKDGGLTFTSSCESVK